MFSVSSVKSEEMISLSFIQYLLQECEAHMPTAYKNVRDEVIWHEIFV